MIRKIPKNNANMYYVKEYDISFYKKIDLTILNNLLNLSSLIFSKHRKPKHK